MWYFFLTVYLQLNSPTRKSNRRNRFSKCSVIMQVCNLEPSKGFRSRASVPDWWRWFKNVYPFFWFCHDKKKKQLVKDSTFSSETILLLTSKRLKYKCKQILPESVWKSQLLLFVFSQRLSCHFPPVLRVWLWPSVQFTVCRTCQIGFSRNK